MKVLIADRISPKGVEYLRSRDGFEVVEAYGSSPEQILSLVKDVHAIAVRSETQISAEVIQAAPLLKAVGRAGVGVDNIDVEAATNRGVVVLNTPTGNTIATAELTFTHLLCGARPVPQASASMNDGKWDRKSFSGIELFRKNLGIIGMGRIGSEVAKRAQAFGMRVLAYDPYLAPSRAKAMEVEAVDLDRLLRESDYITVHMPLTEATQYMLDEAAFEKMKKGVRVFNCARGGIIKESALVQALDSGKVAAAGLDVFEEEPLSADSALRRFPNVVLTPHLGASTKEAQESVGLEVAEALAEALAGGVIRNAVNMPSIDAATLAVLSPYLALGARLGTLVQQIAPRAIEKLKVTYWGKVVDLDANSLTRSILKGYLVQISGDEVNFVNAPVVLQRLGIQLEVTKSNLESDYTELVQVEAVTADGATTSAAGTLIGKSFSPRVVSINGREVEANPVGVLLILENRDVPGIVGTLGSILGKEKVNIAAMSLSRTEAGGMALTVINLDTVPTKKAMEEITRHPAIRNAVLVKF
jgi:D-3-phosphoglycerate dehydrogenase / 2-oxoglutarate reductase